VQAGIVAARVGSVTTVTLNSPDKLNAMSRAMWRALQAAFEAIQADANCRCAYATPPEHQEDIAAFLAKRKPFFLNPKRPSARHAHPACTRQRQR
jgi:enoyl-CoA hydratase/carnithine racemase